ncbi:hypothetical protein [Alloalcanivorax gelatiniphagus]|uniref:Prevent host death protein, Phd antitoxin n=1 Tax=Alloalcanivorax gelatiniphagus TaxID=1194167 RepID=A0ABY2XL60_9GAMM|nr:hypothetical protein [Alloalcanivorax gelatiniphagus]TMW12896.1 hypothetical protein FGS76_08975 [Alloalcanivorax gelatiniphagus]|tara:strand:- start:12374 stop:12562 length:189 start_codon:yes stop_codon:yes gene_type:complete
MQTAKQDVERMLGQLPDDATLEDIEYHLYVLKKIRNGIRRHEEEGGIPQQEVKEHVQQWFTR